MGDMYGQAGALRERNVPKDHDRFGCRRNAPEPQPGGMRPLVHGTPAEPQVFAVGDDRQVKVVGIFQRPPHELAALNRPAVIADRHRPGLPELAEIGQQLASAAMTDGANRMDTCCRHPGFFQDEAGDCGAVIDRPRVRHAGHTRETARCCRLAAGADVFLVFPAGFPQMGVHIDQTGRHPEAGGVDAAGIGGNGLARWREYAVDNEQIALFVPAAGRIQDTAIHNEPGVRHQAFPTR